MMMHIMAKRPRRRRSGFTFIEIILVVAIIGILAGIVSTRLVGKSRDAKIKATQAQMEAIKTSLLQYEINTGEFPSSSDGLKALVSKPSSVSEDDWDKVMDKVPKDAWGEEFIYTYPSRHNMDFDLASKGPDRQEGTEDDITNWEGAEVEGF